MMDEPEKCPECGAAFYGIDEDGTAHVIAPLKDEVTADEEG